MSSSMPDDRPSIESPLMRSVSVHDLKAALDGTTGDGVEPVEVIDVREPWEYAEGHVPGARLVPLASVPQHLNDFPQDFPRDRPVYLVCHVGGRSAQAAHFLAQRGVDAVNVDGGTADWESAGYPLHR